MFPRAFIRMVGLCLVVWPFDRTFQAAGAPGTALVADHLLVKFKPGFAERLRGTGTVSLDEAVASLGLPTGARLEEPAINLLARAQHPAEEPDFDRFLYLRLPGGMDVDRVLRLLEGHPWVDYAERDGVGTGGLLPNDPNFSSQWHHLNSGQSAATIQTPEAWEITVGHSNVLVAVLDSGLNSTLAEFAGRVVPGYNFASNSFDFNDDHGHGTAVTGTLAATGNNGALVAGVDWRCRILPVKVLGYDNSGQYSWWAQGIDFALSKGAKVINLSAGGFGSSTTLTRAITNAIAHGSIFVTITHNDGSNLRYPGNLPVCITVGATDGLDRRCGFSNYGPEIDLVAPGTNIFTVGRGGGIQTWWGTSFAAPLTAGVCALLASVQPGLTHEQARTLLVAGAADGVGDADDLPGFDSHYGWGRLNALNSLTLARTHLGAPVITNGSDLRFSWPCPDNAAGKSPYLIERSLSPRGPWTVVSTTNQFSFTTNRCAWTDLRAATNRAGLFYRLRLRDF